MIVTCCDKFLSIGFCTDSSLDAVLFLFFFFNFLSVAQVLYALVSLKQLSCPTETL